MAPVPAMSPAPGHGLTGIGDAGAFLARLTRLEPAAPVRLRSLSDGARTTLAARLPWGVLVTRTVAGAGPGDVTVAAAQLLAVLAAGGAELPARRDEQWRWPLPPAAAQAVESIPVEQVRRLAAAAAGTLRTAEREGVAGRAVGQRALREALLDHVALVVTGADGPERVEVSQRLVQAVVRMGFTGPVEATGVAQVRIAGRWTGLCAPFGAAWWQSVNNLTIRPMGS